MDLDSHYKNLRYTEDLVVAILLGNSVIKKKKGKHTLEFTLEDNKKFILDMYIEKNNINSLNIEKCNSKFILHSSFILERIIKEWTDSIQVSLIDPRYFNRNMFTIWLCLFGHKKKRAVVIQHNNLTYEVQEVLVRLFKEIMNSTTIVTNNYYFKIGAFDKLVMDSIRNNRPSYETAELGTFLNEKEREQLGIMRCTKEGNNQYA
ncbi:hypothetical protein LG296_19650 (plasmid) [Ureibacillus chungkukjangi]|uniref:hypothetical protein n=1 Tax=Ureibacillus chungkukjangi TaxID=1202712 RepID=UPI000D3C55A3|nr:hypothetical protein [Ureibacillus chungkukjangi]MCM3390572.1 hypothetical protein [Ureibacillus chungkukjangi]